MTMKQMAQDWMKLGLELPIWTRIRLGTGKVR
ncbi:hypothetical protein ES705_29767 [subsurface metagenome]